MRLSTRNPGPHTRRIVRAERPLRPGQTVSREGGKNGTYYVHVRFDGSDGVLYEVVISEADIEAMQQSLINGKPSIQSHDR